MDMRTETLQGHLVAVIDSQELLLTDPQSALDLMATVRYGTDVDAIVLPKAAVGEDFFELRTRVAGEILQKYINYQMKLAIVGDFSAYASKSLRDFIYESNQGRDIFFVPTTEEALRMLDKAFAKG